MKTICDTNIWRKLALGEIPQDEWLKVDSQITATFVNIDEIAKSNLVVSDLKTAKQTIRRIMKVPGRIIFENPIIYLSKLDNPQLEYDINKDEDIVFLLKLTEQIAKGYEVNTENYHTYIRKRDQGFKEFCDFWNTEADSIKKDIKDVREHRNADNIPSNRLLLSKMAESISGHKWQDNFDWQQMELFEKVFGLFTMNMETVGLKMKPNDIYDLLQLIYVQPKDKIWTYDQKIVKRINEAKMGKYLFNSNNVA